MIAGILIIMLVIKKVQELLSLEALLGLLLRIMILNGIGVIVVLLQEVILKQEEIFMVLMIMIVL